MLYGVYPYVIEKFDDMLATGARFGFHLMRDGSLRRLDCHVFDGLTVKSFVLAVVPAGHGWKQKLLRNTLSVLACVTSQGGLSFVCVSDNIRLGRALATVSHPVVPVVGKRFDLDWMRDIISRQFLKEFSGLEPFGVPEYFLYRLSVCISDSAFDQMPTLRRVSIVSFISYLFLLCFFFFFFATGVKVCECSCSIVPYRVF